MHTFPYQVFECFYKKSEKFAPSIVKRLNAVVSSFGVWRFI